MPNFLSPVMMWLVLTTATILTKKRRKGKERKKGRGRGGEEEV